MKARIIFHGIAVLVLFTSVAVAQTPKTKSSTSPGSAAHGQESTSASVSARETGSGMATGRRQHEPISISARETGSGMATGRESSQPSVSEAGITAREAGSGMASGRKSGSIIVLDRESAQGVSTARETGSGMATGKRVSGDPHEYLNSRNSAHATESLNADSTSSVHSNPLYQPSGNQGTNPLYQGKDKTAAPSTTSGSSHEVVEYKDGEDGTTHTRPGNHKPGKMN